MDSTSWQRVKPVLEAVLDAAPHQRRALLAQECGENSSLRRQVEQYLEWEQEADDLFDDAPHALLTTHTRSVLGLPSVGGDPYVGRRIGNYRVREVLGRGGMGTVYRAEREDDFRQQVALKVIRRGMDTEEVVGRFQMERQILANLQHPHIARLLDGGSTDDGLPFFVMEHIDGVPLDRYCDERRLGIAPRLDLFLKVCDAVEAAHRNLIVHRDLKPSNLLVTEDGIPKLLDFGIAKLLQQDQDLELVKTRPERRVMTPRYASPEQVSGGPITTVSDVYSLGVVLFHLMTGHSPYRLDNLTDEIVAKHVQEEDPKRPSTVVGLNEEIPTGQGMAVKVDATEVARDRGLELKELRTLLSGDLDAIVLKALEKEPERRYGSVEQFAEDIRRHLAGLPVKAVPPTLAYRTKRYVKRNAIPVAIASGLMLTLLFYAVTIHFFYVDAVDARLDAEGARAEAEANRDRAEEVTTLLSRTFKAAAPDQARGDKTINLFEILEKGKDRVEKIEYPDSKAEFARILGDVYKKLGELETAEHLFETCLETLRNEYPSDPYPTAHCRVHLGSLLREQGQLEEARKLIESAVNDMQENLGESESLNLANGLDSLGNTYYRLGWHKKAEETLRRSLDMKWRLIASGDPQARRIDADVLSLAQNNLAVALIMLDREEEAVELALESVARQREEGVDKVLSTFSATLSTLGRALFQLDRAEAALEPFQESVEIRRQLYPNGHRDLVGALINLSKAQLQLNQFDQAVSSTDEAVAVLDKLSSLSLRYAGAVRATSAEALALQGSFAEALNRVNAAIDDFQKAQNLESWRLPLAQQTRGLCLSRLGDLEEGERLMIESFQALESDTELSRPDLKNAVKRMISHYEWRGIEETAERYRRQLETL